MLQDTKCSLQQLISHRWVRPVLAVLLCVATVAVVVLLQGSVKTIRISDGDSVYHVRSINGDLTRALNAVSLKSENYRIVSLTEKGQHTAVELSYTFPVYITVGDQTFPFETAKATVKEILEDAGYKVDQYDLVQPHPDTLIEDTVYIDYTDVDYINGSYNEPIAYQTETVYSNTQPIGTKQIRVGKDGVQTVSYTRKLVNGTVTETVITGKTVVAAAVNETHTIGTKRVAASKVKTAGSVKTISTLTPKKEILLDDNGNPVKFKKKMTVQATAYTYTGHNCATGVSPRPGYIAVNPKVIPYGTKLYIKSSDGRYTYGYAIAADTGGFVRQYPNNVDLFMSTESECQAFGRRNVEIYVLN